MRSLGSAILVLLISSPAAAIEILYEGFDYTAGSRLIGQQNSDTNGFWVDPSAPAQPVDDADLHRIQGSSLSYPGLPAPTGGSLAVPRTPNSNISRLRLPVPAGADPVTGSWNVNTIDGDDLTGDSMFFSFVFQLTDFVAGAKGINDTPADIEFIAGFHWGYSDNPPSTPTTNVGPTMTTGGAYGAMVLLRESTTTSGAYELGIIKNNGSLAGGPQYTPENIDWIETAFLPNADPMLVVGEYHFKGNPTSATPAADVSRADDTARLWINPTPGEAAPAPSAETAAGLDIFATQPASVGPFAAGSHIRSFYFRSDDDSPGVSLFDELRIGTTYADVTPGQSTGNGDFDMDGDVDGNDFLVWQRGEAPGGLTQANLDLWKASYPAANAAAAAVPEPASYALAVLALTALVARRRR
jgi:hypothetical protein